MKKKFRPTSVLKTGRFGTYLVGGCDVAFLRSLCLLSIVQLSAVSCDDKFTLLPGSNSLVLAVNASVLPWTGSFYYDPQHDVGGGESSTLVTSSRGLTRLLSIIDTDGTVISECTVYAENNLSSTQNSGDNINSTADKDSAATATAAPGVWRQFSFTLDAKEGLTCWFGHNFSQTFNVTGRIAGAESLVVKLGGFTGCLSELTVQDASISCENFTLNTSTTQKTGILALNSEDIPCGCENFNQSSSIAQILETNSNQSALDAQNNGTINGSTALADDVIYIRARDAVTEAAAAINDTEIDTNNRSANVTEVTTELSAVQANTTSASTTEVSTVVITAAAQSTVRLADSPVTSISNVSSTSDSTTTQETTSAATTEVMTTTSAYVNNVTFSQITQPTPATCDPPCGNGGTCIAGGTCICPPETTGPSTACSWWNVCVKYRGVCLHGGNCSNTQAKGVTFSGDITQNGTFECHCLSGYKGKYCQHVESKLSGGIIALIVICIIVAMALAIGAVFLVRYVRRSRKLKGKYNPAKEEISAGNGPPMPMQALSRDERLI